MGGRPDDIPEAYDAADPARRLPIKVPQLIIQGDLDDIAPLDFVAPYAEVSGADIIVFDQVDHFDVIDPESRTWGAVLRAIDEVISNG